jgi:excinuclease ABC subunit C
MNLFDQKFGNQFFDSVPESPGVYRFLDASSQVIYIGKGKNLRRRLEQYRNAKRRKKHRKMKCIIGDASQIQFQTCPNEEEAEVLETQLIQSLRPKWNVVGAFYFLYPLLGTRKKGEELSFCYTTQPEFFADFELHGAYRSRQITRDGFFSLMRLLSLIGHRSKSSSVPNQPKFSYLQTFRRIPECWNAPISSFLKGESREFLELLALELLENAGARKRSKTIQQELKQALTFWKHEARSLHQARTQAPEFSYPIHQKERDLLFLRAKYKKEAEL